MVMTSKRSSPSAALGMTSNRRPTRRGMFGGYEFEAPYSVRRRVVTRKGLTHNSAIFNFGISGTETAEMWCCQHGIPDDINYTDGPKSANCMQCMLCKGCPACTDGHIDEATMKMGKWESQDGRRLYPFEMDNTHLINTIKKLKREPAFKPKTNRDWLDVLEVEKARRGL